jgi:HTH-type transcriptional regulator/antitoxin HigA
MAHAIVNEEQYETALERAHRLMQKEIIPNSKEAEELEELTSAIVKYEATNYPINTAELKQRDSSLRSE